MRSKIPKRQDVHKRIEQIEKLLAAGTDVHPPGCNCAIMSRDESHHDSACPYRMLKEIVPMLRDAVQPNERLL
jgi:hypothetical protein